MTTPSAIALKIATEAKSTGRANLADTICDAGFYEVPRSHYDCNGLCAEAFDALYDEVEAALPFAHYDRRIARGWARAGADIFAERQAERMAFSLDA